MLSNTFFKNIKKFSYRAVDLNPILLQTANPFEGTMPYPTYQKIFNEYQAYDHYLDIVHFVRVRHGTGPYVENF
jgi:hypothetical protein